MAGRMIALVSDRTEPKIAAHRDITASGSAMVSRTLRNSGSRAVESYLCFLASQRSTSAFVYRSAAGNFFAGCDENGLALDTNRAGHLANYFEVKRLISKPNSTLTCFYPLRELFNHLERDRIIDRSPMVGVPVPMKPERRMSLEAFRALVSDVDDCECDPEYFDAVSVVLYPIIVGMEPCEIAAFTGIPLERVSAYAQRLMENGIWRPDGEIAVSGDTKGSEGIIEIFVQAMCAQGLVVRELSCDGTATRTA